MINTETTNTTRIKLNQQQENDENKRSLSYYKYL